MKVFRGTVMRPNEALDGFERLDDALVVLDDEGTIALVESVDMLIEQTRLELDNTVLETHNGSIRVTDEGKVQHISKGHGYNGEEEIHPSKKLITPCTANCHCHMCQPPGVPGELLKQNDDGSFEGWLPNTLRFETQVKENPELARECARRKFANYIRNGITSSLEYVTSSEEAVRIVLEVADEMGLGDQIKVGYVCMDQGVDFMHEDIQLETSVEEALEATLRLLKDFGDRIVVIDRFPIAVTSPLRKKLVKLARAHGVLYEVHMDESENEINITNDIYSAENIYEVLHADGVFEPGTKVGLAHAIHTTPEIIATIGEHIDDGCEVHIRACPNSNGQLQSHLLADGSYVPFPLKEWQEAGAIVTFGLDKGAGRGWNILHEALDERSRPHPNKYQPQYLELLQIATINGLRSLGIDVGRILRPGSPAHFMVINPDLMYPNQLLPEDLEGLAALTIESGQQSSNIERVYAHGKKLTPNPQPARRIAEPGIHGGPQSLTAERF